MEQLRRSGNAASDRRRLLARRGPEHDRSLDGTARGDRSPGSRRRASVELERLAERPSTGILMTIVGFVLALWATTGAMSDDRD
jgi:hypothetical protein